MISIKNKVIISPPFGSYLSFKGAISVIGSLTTQKRKGAVFQFIKTFRKVKGGYINKIGLRNAGIDSLNKKNFSFYNNKILSIAVTEEHQWSILANKIESFILQGFCPVLIELNVSCPNTSYVYKDIVSIINLFKPLFTKYNIMFSVKLSPVYGSIKAIEQCLENGISVFHLSNTIPSEKGGISGNLLKDKSINLISKAREEFKKDITIIGGGGIYSKLDIDTYKLAGADYFSLATIVIKNPFKIKGIINYANSLKL